VRQGAHGTGGSVAADQALGVAGYLQGAQHLHALPGQGVGDLFTGRLQARSSAPIARGHGHGQLAPVEALAVAQGKKALQKQLGKAVHGAVGGVAAHHQGPGPTHLGRQGREVVVHLAQVVRPTAQTGPAGAHVQLAELDELAGQAAGGQNRLHQAVGVAVFYGAAGYADYLRLHAVSFCRLTTNHIHLL